MNLNVDVAIFIGFLLVNLAVGLSYGRGVRTIKDYALGGRNFSTAALVSTIVATFASGSGFFIDLSNTYSDGLYYLIPVCCMTFQLVLTAYLLIPRMGEFMGKTSVAEVMGDLYGKEVRLITAISGILGTVGLIAVQFKVFGNVFNYYLGIESTKAILLASTIVILYSAFGGVRSVTYTDIIQFITFGFVVPLIGIIIWNHNYDTGFVFSEVIQQPKFNYKEVLNFNNPAFWGMIPLMLYFGLPSVIALDFQRISMGSNIAQVQKAWAISAILLLLITLATGWISFLFQVTNPDLPPDQIMSYIADNYTYTGLKGLIIIGIAALAMSTADSCINASAVLFANDVAKVLEIKTNDLLLSRVFSLLLGISAIYLALSKADLLGIVMTTASLYMPVVTVPLLLAIFGFRSTKIPVLIAMGGGLITIISTNIFNIKADGIIWGMLVNFILLISSHYLLKQPGGWVGIRDMAYLNSVRANRRRKIANLITAIKEFNFIEFCKQTAPKNELMYMGLGIYCILYTFTTIYSTHVELLKENGKIVLAIYQIMMITGVIMAMYPIWPLRIKHKIIVQVAWNIVIFYMLIFFSCFMVMVSNFGQLQFMVFSLNIVTTAILVGWKLGLGMALVGFYLSTEFYKYYAAVENLDITIGSPQFIFMYMLMLAGSTLIIFLKPKEEYQALTEEKNEHLNDRINLQEKELNAAFRLKHEFIRNVSHEYHAPMTGIMSTSEILHEAYDKLTEQQRREAIQDIYESSARLKSFDNNIVTLARLSKTDCTLDRKKIDLSELVYNRVQICRKFYEHEPDNRQFNLNIEEGIEFNCDETYISQAIDNLIINSINYCPAGEITIDLKRDAEGIKLTIRDEGIGIPKEEIYNIFEPFFISSKTRTPAGGRGIGLAVSQRIIEVHGGRIEAESDGIKGSTFRVILSGI